MRATRRGLLTAPLVLSLPAFAQGFPARPIRVVVGFPAGGGVDTLARPIMARLQDRLGQPVVIDNRAGNNGNIAMDHVAKSAPDGYTLFIGNVGNLAITHALFPNLPFDTTRDFAGVAQTTLGPLAVAVPADFPARTLAELVEMARARPGTLNMASGGSGGVPHLAFEQFKRTARVDIVHVPYRGSAPALQDLLGGRVQMMIDGYGLMRGAHEAGRIRVIAMTSHQRHPQLPDVQTIGEAGFRGAEFESWQAVVAPKATPEPIRQVLEDGLRHVFTNTDIPQVVTSLGTFPAFAPGAVVDASIIRDRRHWTDIVREGGIQAD